MIDTGIFPDQLKVARISPVYKKENPLEKKNYRPVSILPAISKVFERAISTQLDDMFSKIFHPHLSAFRKGYSCQSTLIALTEEWRAALDSGNYAAAILMDLSKAFDCVPTKLLVEKLRAYGMQESAVNLIENYMSGRKQCVRVNGCTSSLLDVKKGVPQGSILGPIIFNIFINDIFFLTKETSLHNYADDNTLSFVHKDIKKLKETLERECLDLVRWFENNRMQANPDKFQAIALGRKCQPENVCFNVGNVEINTEETVKLLGVHIDSLLNFDVQIKMVCKRASRQANALGRIAKHLTIEGRKAIYHAFIMSNFNFCPLVWHFCSKMNTKKLEKVNYRALRFVFQDFNVSYEELLLKMKSCNLEVQRLRLVAIETFKILNGIGPAYLNDFITEKQNVYTFRYNRILEIPRTKTVRYGSNSFKSLAASVWNSLPDHLRTCTSLNSFKNLIRQWNGQSCRCAICKN